MFVGFQRFQVLIWKYPFHLGNNRTEAHTEANLNSIGGKTVKSVKISKKLGNHESLENCKNQLKL